MSIGKHLGETLVLSVIFIGLFSPAATDAQTNNSRREQIKTLGLPLPGSDDTKYVVAPFFGGGRNYETYANMRWDPTVGALTTRILSDPVVSKDNIGFFNPTGKVIKFQIEIASNKRTITLGVNEVLTIPVAGNGPVKGTIGSGAVDTTSPLTPGTIYKVSSQADKWMFAKF